MFMQDSSLSLIVGGLATVLTAPLWAYLWGRVLLWIYLELGTREVIPTTVRRRVHLALLGLFVVIGVAIFSVGALSR